ncbi:PDDEXK nuclease domain-containing protein [Clostridium sp. 001]|uniref:PDDEXK nuclease domain-containing protein n=1 Tax=Clostridium sp. 001 TaxID=1970093 RepID=UPI001C2BF63B|nr:PDDEXK nuclease domain-containing protein [Clostridium sp. 001]QXE17962.1 hypothetical protein B5S50_03360 [Clostridium sp. 001]
MIEHHNDMDTFFKNLEEDIILFKNKALVNINEYMFMLYWKIGNLILMREKEGCESEFISETVEYLKGKFPGNLCFTEKNLENMARFAEEYNSQDYVSQLSSKISWSCNLILMNKIRNVDKRKEYIDKMWEKDWSVEDLIGEIDKECGIEELDYAELFNAESPEKENIESKSIITSEEKDSEEEKNEEKTKIKSEDNFCFIKDAISKEQGEDLSEGDIKKFSPILKDEYLMDFMDISDEIKEKAFQQHFIKSVVEFFLELNSGFALVGKKHHMELSGGDYYEDLLFYNLKLKCYIAVELKIGKFKPEYLGILTFHLSAMDDSVRDEGDNSSIGIVLCKDGEKLIVQYAFKDVDDPKNAEYMLSENIPEQFEGILPTIKEIGRGIKIKLKD